MKLFKLGVVFLLIFGYLYFSYARFYHIIGEKNLKSPYHEAALVINNPKAIGAITYVALGDSLTAGVGSSAIHSTFVYQYALNLSKTAQKVSVLNLGQPGGTTVDLIGNQLSKTIDAKPNYITLLIGTNDIHNKRFLNDFHDKYQYILNQLLNKTTAQIIVINIPYLGANQVVYLPFNLLLNYRINQFNHVIESLVNQASTKRITYIDLYKATYTRAQQDPTYYASDLFHPSESSYIYWGQIINAR